MTADPSPPEIQRLLPFTMKTNGETYLATVPLLQSNTLQIYGEQHYEDAPDNEATPRA